MLALEDPETGSLQAMLAMQASRQAPSEIDKGFTSGL